MPASFTIAIFVFGAVLFLIGLLGGAFKLFGTEVAGTAGPRVRGVSLVLGTVFIAWGVLRETRIPPLAANAATRLEAGETALPRNAPLAAEPAPTRTVPSPIQESAPDLGDLSGIWRDETGTVYQVVLRGNGYAFQAKNNQTGGVAEGFTRVQGLRWTSEFQTNGPSTGTGSGSFSADGTQMTGVFNDTRLGTYSRTLSRVR